MGVSNQGITKCVPTRISISVRHIDHGIALTTFAVNFLLDTANSRVLDGTVATINYIRSMPAHNHARDIHTVEESAVEQDEASSECSEQAHATRHASESSTSETPPTPLPQRPLYLRPRFLGVFWIHLD